MAVQNIAFVVFLLPVVLSLVFGTFVLADVLNQPDRELNIWQFDISEESMKDLFSEDIEIQNLLSTYSISEPIEIEIVVTDPDFDCGDLYITIYSIDGSQKEVISQNGFFGQCFIRDNLTLPTEDEFSEKIDSAGKYEMVVELNDKHQKKTITSVAQFLVE